MVSPLPPAHPQSGCSGCNREEEEERVSLKILRGKPSLCRVISGRRGPAASLIELLRCHLALLHWQLTANSQRRPRTSLHPLLHSSPPALLEPPRLAHRARPGSTRDQALLAWHPPRQKKTAIPGGTEGEKKEGGGGEGAGKRQGF